MDLVPLAALLIYTFGAFAYGGLLALWVREKRRAWATVADSSAASARTVWVSGALWTVSFLWFVTNLLLVLTKLAPDVRLRPLEFAGLWAMLWLTVAFPPLIAHITWAEVTETRPTTPGRGWGFLVGFVYILAVCLAVGCTLGFLGRFDVSRHEVERWISVGSFIMFIGAAVFSMALITRYPPPARTVREAQSSRWHVALFACMALLFALVFFLIMRNAPVPAVFGQLLEIALKSLPIAFMFVGTYFENRFEFFDLFVKRGISLFVTIGVLVLAFAATLPWLPRHDSTPATPWIYAIVLLPIAMALPSLHAWIGSVLDRRWLGRRFTTVEALKLFLAGLRSATSDKQLIESAEAGLSRIFDAPAFVRLEALPAAAPAFDVVEDVEVRAGAGIVGRFLMGTRRSDAPYFSEDIALLMSLADVFASVLDNLHLQRREQEQDRRAQELSLHASRSELKALRAQINPHFLFNALNAIANLVHQNPAEADRTIEKLADVFRYALRGGESEWALLDDELEFVRAYLEVEQARFGTRLKTEVRLADEARGALVPTMVVQTLVENAVKHGAAATKGQAIVRIDARRDDGRLRIVVEDNGPGFEQQVEATARSLRHGNGGYGLVNVRRRLEGHFGTAASLTIDRETSRGLTVVLLTLPLVREEPRSLTTTTGTEVER